MAAVKYDVTGIGNAIVDVLAKVDDDFLAAQGLDKGSMALIDAERADALYALLSDQVEESGGSAGNTMAGIAQLGGKGAYIGKVRGDDLGKAFRSSMTTSGVHFSTPAADKGPSTARCIVLVTPDAQRTLCTYLGACVGLGPDDVSAELVQNSKVTYLEGYLWDPPLAKEAFLKAAQLAHEAHRQVALSLSDGFCVDRHRDEFLALVQDHVDILFANEDEIRSLYQVETFEDALDRARDDVAIAALTRSEKGAVIVEQGEAYTIRPSDVSQVVDTTGAGDLFAAGFLWAHTQGRPAPEAGKAGAICAAEIISHFGARPYADLSALVAEKL